MRQELQPSQMPQHGKYRVGDERPVPTAHLGIGAEPCPDRGVCGTVQPEEYRRRHHGGIELRARQFQSILPAKKDISGS